MLLVSPVADKQMRWICCCQCHREKTNGKRGKGLVIKSFDEHRYHCGYSDTASSLEISLCVFNTDSFQITTTLKWICDEYTQKTHIHGTGAFPLLLPSLLLSQGIVNTSRKQQTWFHFHTYMTINDHNMNQDWIFMVGPNPPQSASDPLALSLTKKLLSLWEISHHPWGNCAPLHQPAAHMVSLCLICSLQLWTHAGGVWNNEYTGSILYLQLMVICVHAYSLRVIIWRWPKGGLWVEINSYFHCVSVDESQRDTASSWVTCLSYLVMMSWVARTFVRRFFVL